MEIEGINATAKAILKISLGIKGVKPAKIALSYPIIDPKYPTPSAKIIIEPIIIEKRQSKYESANPF